MEKCKRQQYVEIGDEILTYMQKFEKNYFYQSILKSDPSPKNYQTKRKTVLEHPIRNIEMESSDEKARKNDKGGQKAEKRPKMSINRSWHLIFTIAIQKLTKRRKTHSLKDLISGDSLDKMNFSFDQVSTKSSLFHFHTSIMQDF
jgi:hypothetical protein